MTRILILDDRPINRQFLTTLLAYKGIETREASDGREGLEVARQWPPDLAIVDIEMPVMDGVEFVRQLHADRQLASTPIIFYTASYEASDAERMARECGVEHVLMKPSEPELILSTIEKALGRSTARPRSQLAEAAASEFVRLHSDASRMTALVDFQLQIAGQRQPADILKLLARVARTIVPSTRAVVTMVDGNRTTEFSSEDAATPPHQQEKVTLRVPIETATARYGWISLTSREGAGDYSRDDGRIIQTIAAQTAMAYENLMLYEKVREEARHRQLLLESTGDGIYAIDNHGRCTMVNRVASNLVGRSLDELIGSHVHDLIHHHKPDGAPYPAETCEIYRAFRAGKASRVVDEVFWRKDGSSFPVEYVSSPIIDEEDVRGAVVTFSDVTERRRLERRLEQINRISSLGRMAVTIGHEFNNVLMGIQPFAEVIRRRAGEDAKLQQAATQILSSVSRGKGITQDILRMTRTSEPALQSIDVSQWLEQLAVEIRAVVAASIAVNVQVPSHGTLFARCDPTQMQQVVTNLALNARDAMAGGGTLSLSAGRNDSNVRVVVGDTGCGIPAETLPFIFEPLFTTKHSGTGLGLAVAQQLVLRNGGAITVESAVGAGTWFHIELPEAPMPVSAAPSEQRGAPQRGSVRRVVIVEDDLAVALGLSAVLESEDIEVRVVHLGSEAMSAVAAFKPDAVVIDVSLPDVSGTVVYEQIAAKWPEMGVIFSTGHADESGVPRASSRHVGFLRKPYSSEELLSKLREVV